MPKRHPDHYKGTSSKTKSKDEKVPDSPHKKQRHNAITKVAMQKMRAKQSDEKKI